MRESGLLTSLLGLVMAIRSVNKKGRISHLWMADPIVAWKPPEATWLWNGLLWGWRSPLRPHTARPAAMGWSQGLTSPTEALGKASCGIVPRDSHQGRPFYTPGLYSMKQNNKKGLRGVKWGHSGSGRCCKWSLIRGWKALAPPSHSLACRSYSLKPIILFQKLPWLKRN